MTVAEQYPPKAAHGEVLWYKPQPRSIMGRDGAASDGGTGWTCDPGYADVSYGVGDGKGTSFIPWPPVP